MVSGSDYRKRVLMVTSVFPRWEGDATPPFVRNLAEAVVERDWDIAVLAPHAAGAKKQENLGRIRVRRFCYFVPESYQKLCYEGGMLVNFRRRPWVKYLLPFFLVAQRAALWSEIRYLRPDILHSHSLLPQGLVVQQAARKFGIRHVSSSHGNDVFGLRPDGMMGRWKRSVLKNADAITVNSSSTREAVMALGCRIDKVHQIAAAPNRPELDPLVVNKLRERFGKDAKIVLFVGRLIPEKGVYDLVEAAQHVLKSDQSCLFIFAGAGPELSGLKAAVDRADLGTRIVFPGWIQGDQISSWMSVADLLVVPSREIPGGWKEAQGLVAVEAMGVGTRVVASDCGGLAESVEDGVTGYLTPPGDPLALARRIGAALSDVNADTVSHQALRRYNERYSCEAVSGATVALYNQLMGTS